jgi:hypothetical protein
MPLAGPNASDRAAAHYKWARRYAKREDVPSSLAHLRRALRYTTAFGQIKCLLYTEKCSYHGPRGLLKSLTSDTKKNILILICNDNNLKHVDMVAAEFKDGSDAYNYQYVMTDCIDVMDAIAKHTKKPDFVVFVFRASWKSAEGSGFPRNLEETAYTCGYRIGNERNVIAWFENSKSSEEIYYRVFSKLQEVPVIPERVHTAQVHDDSAYVQAERDFKNALVVHVEQPKLEYAELESKMKKAREARNAVVQSLPPNAPICSAGSVCVLSDEAHIAAFRHE